MPPEVRSSSELSKDSPLDQLYVSIRVPDPTSRTIDWADFTAKVKSLGPKDIPNEDKISAGIIHQAVSLRPSPPVEAIEALIDFYPQALVTDRHNYKCFSNPEGHWLIDSMGYFQHRTEYPLPLACHGAEPSRSPTAGSTDMVRAIVRSMAASEKEYKERRAKAEKERQKVGKEQIITMRDWEESKKEHGFWAALCASFFSEHMEQQWTRSLPLHLMEVIFEEYPDALLEHTTIAGHVILLMRKDPEYFQKVKLVAQTTMKYDLESLLYSFLRLICDYDSKPSCILLPYMDGFRYKDIHLIVIRLIELFEKDDPKAFNDWDNDGRTPLHFFIEHVNAPWSMKMPFTGDQCTEVVRALIRGDPGALIEKDDFERFPFHIAIARGLPCADFLMDLTLKLQPNALTMKCGDPEELYPFQLPALCAASEKEWRKKRPHLYRKSVEDIETEAVSKAYQLIQSDPNVVKQLAPKREPWMDCLKSKKLAMNEMKIAALLGENIRLRSKIETIKRENRKRKRGENMNEKGPKDKLVS